MNYIHIALRLLWGEDSMIFSHKFFTIWRSWLEDKLRPHMVTFAFKHHMWIHKKGQDKTLNLNEPNPYSSLFFPFYPLKVEKMMFRCQVSSCCTSSWACPCSSDWWPWPWPWPPNIDSLSFKVRTPSTMLHKETAANTWFFQISRATCEGFTCAFWGDQCSSTGESNSSRMTIQNR